MRTQLVEYLFGPGAKPLDLENPDLGERIVRMFEEADEAEQETMAIDKKPLQTVLDKLGISGEVVNAPPGTEIRFENGDDYREAFLAIFTPDAMHDLAEAGWVPTRSGDIAMSNEPACFKINFFEIDVAADEASNADKGPDLEQIAKDSNEDGSAEMTRDDDDLNPVENPDAGNTGNAKKGDRHKGVGKQSDGKDPEGKPKGASANESQTPSRSRYQRQEERQASGTRTAQDIADRLLETTTTSGVPPVSEPPLAVMRPPQNRPDRLKKRKFKPTG